MNPIRKLQLNDLLYFHAAMMFLRFMGRRIVTIKDFAVCTGFGVGQTILFYYELNGNIHKEDHSLQTVWYEAIFPRLRHIPLIWKEGFIVLFFGYINVTRPIITHL